MNSSQFPSSEQLDLQIESCRNLVYSLELLELEILNEEKKSSNFEGCQKQGILHDRPGKRWMQCSTGETGLSSAVFTKRLRSPLRFNPVETAHHSSTGFVSTDSSRGFTFKSSPGGKAGIKQLAPKVIIPDSNFGKWLCPTCGKRKRSKEKVFIFYLILYCLTLLLIKLLFDWFN